MQKFNQHILFFLFILLSQHGIIAQPLGAVTTKWDYDNTQNESVFNATNHDYCPYFIILNNGFSAKLNPGDNTLFRVKREEASSYIISSYRYYSGDIYAKVNANHIYALPVATSKSVSIRQNRGILQFEIQHTSDTVYACRDGVVCREFDAQRQGKQITVYHNDGTFAQYRSQHIRLLVKPGETVKTGMPIAIVGVSEARIFEIHFFYLDKNKVKDTNIGYKHTSLNPFFHTKNHGKLRLEDNKYSTIINRRFVLFEVHQFTKLNFKFFSCLCQYVV